MAHIMVAKIDEVDSKLNQLHSLLVSISGPGYENFSELNKNNQENLLWLALDLTTQIKQAMVNGPSC